jgi:hypothetical protein
MTGRRDSFSKLDVTVTLSGDEWFVLLGRLESTETLPLNGKIYVRGMGKLKEQLLTALAAGRANLQQEGGEQ